MYQSPTGSNPLRSTARANRAEAGSALCAPPTARLPEPDRRELRVQAVRPAEHRKRLLRCCRMSLRNWIVASVWIVSVAVSSCYVLLLIPERRFGAAPGLPSLLPSMREGETPRFARGSRLYIWSARLSCRARSSSRRFCPLLV